ncbi:hypothetical protein DFQ30_007412 [Apophysomyces sp. BC1015]|nr:hypothetical protein DFQ30_007412 [Apophysomyces sp. BC1015]
MFFSLVGFILVLLCLVGCRSASGQSLYFAKITDRPAGNLTILYGLQGYCVLDKTTNCVSDDGVMIVPFDVMVSNMLNATYPRLVEDAIEQDQNLNPLATPTPLHNPKLFPAIVMCLICGGAAFLIGVARTAFYRYVQDEHYSRGFLAWGSAVLSLLLVAECSVMYQNGVKELNVVYPHLEATEGPGRPITGVAFAAFAIAGYTYMHGCFAKDDVEIEDGYNPL